MNILQKPLPHAQRGENESFKDYKLRMKRQKRELKEFKKGRFFYQNAPVPYVREKRKKLGKSKIQ